MSIQQQIKEAKALLAGLQTQVVSLLLPKIGKGVRISIGEKGGLVIYGLQRAPYCMYFSQAIKMQAILNSPEFAKFCADNMNKLATKEEVKAE